MTFQSWEFFLIWIIRRCERAKGWSKKYRANNLDKCRAQSRQWMKLNPGKARAAYARWAQKEPESKRAAYKRWYTKRGKAWAAQRRKDPEVRLVRCYRKRVWDALRGFSKKSAKTLELLGCPVSKLKEHLEKQFTPGMSWENYGEWHVDHIRACAKFDLTKETEQRECFNFKNLQPLWKLDNFRKGAR